MTPADIDRVFGRARLRMVTGDHVEVFREASLPGERRRYTKRFLATAAGDFRHWTEREWRILARLVGHGIGPVPDVVQFDRGASDRPALVQTYDAGITVDHWATLLPVERDGWLLRHVFEDCAHWWALARHCLIALDAIHELNLVHLDLKADNVCIPVDPADFDPHLPDQRLTPRFEQIALIDFAFSLVSGESLVRALPIARQVEYDYQSPRLLNALEAGSRGNLSPTRELDWRCDVFSLAAMLRRYLPDPEGPLTGEWTNQRHAQARALVRRLLQAHDEDLPAQRPHAELIALASHPLNDAELAASLKRGWTLATHSDVSFDDSPTPVTRIALPVSTGVEHEGITIERDDAERASIEHVRRGRDRMRAMLWTSGLVGAAAVGVPLLGETWLAVRDHYALDSNGIASQATGQQERATAQPGRVPGSAPTEVSTAASIGETAIGTGPARADQVATEPSPAPAPAAQSASAVAPAAERASAGVPATERASGTAPAIAMRPKLGAARGPQGSASTGAGAAAHPARAVAHAAPPPRGGVAAPESARARAMAHLSTRGPAPRFAQSSGASPTPAPAVAPAPAPARAPAPAPLVATAPAPSPLPAAMPPLPATQSDELPAPLPRDYVARASELMEGQIPRIAQRAERLVLRVLFVAAHSDDATQDDEIRKAARAVRREPQDLPIEVGIAVSDARLLNEAARVAFRHRGSVQEALSLQTKAFGANPLDPEVVGNLALLHLKQHPRQADSARQLALYALTMPDPRYPEGRIEDWNTLAIASALTGRDRDARNAWFVTLALAPDLERQCRGAINAYAAYGEPLRSSIEAMLYRAHASGRSSRSPFCEWPPYWMATSQSR